MVLLAAELIRRESPLLLLGEKSFSENYQIHCKAALEAWNWEPSQLQRALDNVRKEAISYDRKSWLASHRAFPNVPTRLRQLNAEGYEFAVLTTKSSEFTAELLNHFHITPSLLYGHESGSKTNVLLELTRTHILQGFIEDRLATLQAVVNTNKLDFLPCYLAGWGYLKDSDAKALPPNIHLLDLKTFLAPLATWPSFASVRLYYKEL